MILAMDATTIDKEFEQWQAEFEDGATTVQGLATKMQAAEKAGDVNATEWLGDLKRVAQDIDEEQAQVKSLLLAIHEYIGTVAQAHEAEQGQKEQAPATEEKPPLFAPGHDPAADEPAQPPQHHGFLGGMLGGVMGGGMLGGGMMGGGYYGGYYGSSFGQAMGMGMAMNLGANLVSGIFH